MLKERDAKLEGAGDPHRFLKDLDRCLKDLDHSQAWQPKTESDIANTDFPASWAVAEKLLSTLHQMWKNRQTLLPQSLNLAQQGRQADRGPALPAGARPQQGREPLKPGAGEECSCSEQHHQILFIFLKGKDDERVPLAHKPPLTELRFTLVSSDLPKPSAASGPFTGNSTVSHRLRDWIQ